MYKKLSASGGFAPTPGHKLLQRVRGGAPAENTVPNDLVF